MVTPTSLFSLTQNRAMGNLQNLNENPSILSKSNSPHLFSQMLWFLRVF